MENSPSDAYADLEPEQANLYNSIEPQIKPSTADISESSVSAVESANGGLRPDQIWARAQESMKANGITDDTKRQFGEAIAAADQLFTSQDRELCTQILDILETGLRVDGTPLTAEDRVQAHMILASEFSNAQLSLAYRQSYAVFLNTNKQFASAESAFKDLIVAADKIPQDLIQRECQYLLRDMSDPQISREDSVDLNGLYVSMNGDGNSHQSGLVNASITTRTMLAAFYIGATASPEGDVDGGVLKPELAMAALEDAAKLEEAQFGLVGAVDRDPVLAAMAQQIFPLLPENVRKLKENVDGLWSDIPVDAASAAAAILAVGVIATALTRNPGVFENFLAISGEGLTIAGKAVLGATAVSGTVVARHLLHKALTGNEESWEKSLIHGLAGDAMIAAGWFARDLAGKWLFKNASAQQLVERVGSIMPRASGAPLTVGDFNSVLAANGAAPLVDANGVVAAGRELISDVGAISVDVPQIFAHYSPAQLSRMATYFPLPGAEGAGTVARSITRVPDAIKTTFSPLIDLSTASATGLKARGIFSGYLTSATVLGAYRTVGALDAPVDSATGEPADFFQTALQANSSTLAEALAVAPFLQAGALPGLSPAAAPGYFQRATSAITYPFRASGFAASEFKYLNQPYMQAPMLAVLPNIYPEMNNYGYQQASSNLQSVLEAQSMPIKDQFLPELNITENDGTANDGT